MALSSRWPMQSRIANRSISIKNRDCRFGDPEPPCGRADVGHSRQRSEAVARRDESCRGGSLCAGASQAGRHSASTGGGSRRTVDRGIRVIAEEKLRVDTTPQAWEPAPRGSARVPRLVADRGTAPWRSLAHRGSCCRSPHAFASYARTRIEARPAERCNRAVRGPRRWMRRTPDQTAN